MSAESPVFSEGSPPTEPPAGTYKSQFANASSRAGRFMAVTVVIALGIGGGLVLPILLQDWISHLPAAGIAVGAAALLAVVRGLFESVPIAWDFIDKGSREVLPKLFAQIAVAALGLGFAYFAATPADNPGRLLNLSVSSVPPMVMNDSDSLFTAYVVFEEWKSQLPARDAQLDLVNNLVDSLAGCIQSPADRVELVVRGYASTLGTDAVNENLFRDRTDYVIGLLTNRVAINHAAKVEQFKVDPRYRLRTRAA